MRIFAETNSKLMRKALLSIPKKFGLLTFVIVCILTACSKKDEKAHCIMPAGTTLEEGDIVLRKGTGLTSRAVRIADGGSDFSHCGIIVDSCGMKMVVHAVPDEPDFEGDVDRVKMERPEDFFSTIRASKGCVLRYRDRETAEKSARLAYGIYKRGTLFDDDYNDSDTTKMYCSQLVAHVYQKCGIDITNGIRRDTAGSEIQPRHLPLRLSQMPQAEENRHIPGHTMTAPAKGTNDDDIHKRASDDILKREQVTTASKERTMTTPFI